MVNKKILVITLLVLVYFIFINDIKENFDQVANYMYQLDKNNEKYVLLTFKQLEKNIQLKFIDYINTLNTTNEFRNINDYDKIKETINNNNMLVIRNDVVVVIKLSDIEKLSNNISQLVFNSSNEPLFLSRSTHAVKIPIIPIKVANEYPKLILKNDFISLSYIGDKIAYNPISIKDNKITDKYINLIEINNSGLFLLKLSDTDQGYKINKVLIN